MWKRSIQYIHSFNSLGPTGNSLNKQKPYKRNGKKIPTISFPSLESRTPRSAGRTGTQSTPSAAERSSRPTISTSAESSDVRTMSFYSSAASQSVIENPQAALGVLEEEGEEESEMFERPEDVHRQVESEAPNSPPEHESVEIEQNSPPCGPEATDTAGVMVQRESTYRHTHHVEQAELVFDRSSDQEGDSYSDI